MPEVPTTDGGTVDVDPGPDKATAVVIAMMIQQMRRAADARNTLAVAIYNRQIENWQRNNERPEMPDFRPPPKLSYTYTGIYTDADKAFVAEFGPDLVAEPFKWPPLPGKPPSTLTLGVVLIPGRMWDDPTDSVKHNSQHLIDGVRVVGIRSPTPFSPEGFTSWLEKWDESEHGPWKGD